MIPVGVMAFVCLCLLSLTSIAATSKISDKENKVSLPLGDIAAGKIKSEDNRCQECHGPDGNGEGPATGAAGKFAKLAGQHPNYMVKQLREFRSGERKHDLMSLMAKSIDDSDSADIAAYFSSQKKMQGDGSGNNAVGKNLFVNGDIKRNILACASCHGADGKGLEVPDQTIPIIGGQEWKYLEKQLQDWRSGERHNSANGIMNQIAKSLTDEEIQALTNYISGL